MATDWRRRWLPSARVPVLDPLKARLLLHALLSRNVTPAQAAGFAAYGMTPAAQTA